MTDTELLNNIERIQERILNAATQAQRDSHDITLLLATKTRSPETINQALALGYGLIVDKAPFLSQEATLVTPRETHFIGTLQGNKVNEVTELADCIQSVDRTRIARRIHQYAADHNFTQRIMIQVNSSRDPQKQGVLPEDLPQFLTEISDFSHLSIQGLMTIGMQSDDEMIVRKGFSDLRELQFKMISEGLLPKDSKDLSMGMSQDLELAILEGATILRVGSDIFGARS